MKECQRSMTLRQYLENYQELKRSQSDRNLLSVQRPSQVMYKSTQEIEVHITQKMQWIKKILTEERAANTEILILDCLHEVSKMINQVFQKLKALEGIDGTLRYTQQYTAAPVNNKCKKITLHQKKANCQKIRRLKSQESVQSEPKQLIAPQEMQKQIELSKDLSNLNLSSLITTQDFSMKQATNKLVEKAKNLGESTSSQTYFRKRIKTMKSLGPDLQFGQEATADQYQIKISAQVGHQST